MERGERVERRREHCTSFLTGLLIGLSTCVVIQIALLIHSERSKDFDQYLAELFRIYWLFVYIVVHIDLLGVTVYAWRRYNINYQAIFGYTHRGLSFREFFLIGAELSVVSLSAFLLQFFLRTRITDPYPAAMYIDRIPAALLSIILLILLWQLRCRRFFSASRSFFVRAVLRAICAPFYEVTFADSFLVDQLTSQIESIRILELYICLYGFNKYYDRYNECGTHEVYKTIDFIFGVLPYVTKLLQTLRRFILEKQRIHLFNLIKIAMTILAVIFFRASFEIHSTGWWRFLAVTASLVSPCLNIYADIVIDWRLLQRQSTNYLLRDHLCIPHKGVYYAAMVIDILLRFVWIQVLVKFDLPILQKDIVISIFSLLEIIRRSIWNFFRVESEESERVAGS